MNQIDILPSPKPLIFFAEKLIDTENGKLLFDQYQHYFNTLQPFAALEIFNSLSMKEWETEKIKKSISMLSNLFYKPLLAKNWKYPQNNSFIDHLLSDNRKLELIISEIKQLIKKNIYNPGKLLIRFTLQLRSLLPGLHAYRMHQLKVEKILVPAFNHVLPQFQAYTKIMKFFYEDLYLTTFNLHEELQSSTPSAETLNKEIGKLCFLTFLMIFREEHIFYPVAIQSIDENSWDNMFKEGINTGLI